MENSNPLDKLRKQFSRLSFPSNNLHVHITEVEGGNVSVVVSDSTGTYSRTVCTGVVTAEEAAQVLRSLYPDARIHTETLPNYDEGGEDVYLVFANGDVFTTCTTLEQASQVISNELLAVDQPFMVLWVVVFDGKILKRYVVSQDGTPKAV